jgi:FkbH-like protein
LPMVAVPELPDDPSWFAWYLTAAGYFEAVTYSAEDRLRAESYVADSRRAEVMTRARDLGDYLSSLAMVITFAPFDPKGRRRITQLINKTNQFNLTTRRFTEAEVVAMERDDALFTLQVRLEDRFGDLGMIAVVICRPAGAEGDHAWDIDTWLMSCRVLGRQVEEAMLARIVAAARARNVKRLIGTYIATAKNGMVSDHYLRLGFAPLDQSGGAQRFVLPVAAFEPPVLCLKVVDRFVDGADPPPGERAFVVGAALAQGTPAADPRLGAEP